MKNEVRFSINKQTAWAPGLESPEAWRAWAAAPYPIFGEETPPVSAMPSMLRRRANFLGKMALEVAYACVEGEKNIPCVFCSRHGEVSRSLDMLVDLSRKTPLSPTTFSLSVHNAVGSLFSIARGDHANLVAVAGGSASVESAVIEACGLLADGEDQVLLVVCDAPLPEPYRSFEDQNEQPYAWAWLIGAAEGEIFSLSWSKGQDGAGLEHRGTQPSGLEPLRFCLSGESELRRSCRSHRWLWKRDV